MNQVFCILTYYEILAIPRSQKLTRSFQSNKTLNIVIERAHNHFQLTFDSQSVRI